MKVNAKKILIAIVALLVVIVVGYHLSPLKGQSGEKEIYISIVNDETGEILLDSKGIKTEAESLGEALIEYQAELQMEAEASEYGLYITGFMGLSSKENGATGPWWMYSYESPSQDLVMPIGHAPGVDSLKIHDGDVIVFSYTTDMGM